MNRSKVSGGACTHASRAVKSCLGALAAVVMAAGCGGAQSTFGTTGDNPFESMTSTQEGISAAPPPCGTVIGSFNGTPIYSNGPDQGTDWSCRGAETYGLGYQCVELVNRYFITHGLGARIWGNAGSDMCNNAGSDYVVYRPGSNVRPQPGDALEWENGANTGGHTAIVTGSSSNWVTFAQQNVGTRYTYFPTDGVSWNGSSFGWYGSLRPVCWIHPKRAGTAPAIATAECSSATLDKNVPSGTCVQAASDQQWYHCANGAWYGGETSCTATYGWCHSATMNEMVPPRTCVHSKFDGIEYQCGANGGWYSGVTNGSGVLGACAQMLP